MGALSQSPKITFWALSERKEWSLSEFDKPQARSLGGATGAVALGSKPGQGGHCWHLLLPSAPFPGCPFQGAAWYSSHAVPHSFPPSLCPPPPPRHQLKQVAALQGYTISHHLPSELLGPEHHLHVSTQPGGSYPGSARASVIHSTFLLRACDWGC